MAAEHDLKLHAAHSSASLSIGGKYMPLPHPSRVETVNPYQSPSAEPRPRGSRADWPVWVRIGLWKIPSRRVAWWYLGASLGLLFSTALLGFWPGLIFLLAVYWYWESIRWVDEFGQWS